MSVLQNLFTEADNATWDVGRCQWAAGTVVFFALSLYSYIYRQQPFDPIAWGTGFGAVMAAGGAMIWMKGKEPDAVDTGRPREQDHKDHDFGGPK